MWVKWDKYLPGGSRAVFKSNLLCVSAAEYEPGGRNSSSLQFVTSGAPEYSAAADSDDHLSAGREQQSDGKEK